MPDITLTETVSVTSRDISDEERRLASRYNALVDKCITWAGQQMSYGTHATKLSLTRSVLAAASRLAVLDTKTQTEEHRVAFQSLLSDMAKVNAADTPALTVTTTDQNEEGGDYSAERDDR